MRTADVHGSDCLNVNIVADDWEIVVGVDMIFVGGLIWFRYDWIERLSELIHQNPVEHWSIDRFFFNFINSCFLLLNVLLLNIRKINKQLNEKAFWKRAKFYFNFEEFVICFWPKWLLRFSKQFSFSYFDK